MTDEEFYKLYDDIDMVKAGLDLLQVALCERDRNKELKKRCADLQIETAEILKKLEPHIQEGGE